MRLLILLALAYLGYRAVKSWLLENTSFSKPPDSSPETREIDDVMVKDPVCNVYFARKEGVHARIEGEDMYFCSTECRDRYMETKKRS